jgi:hypothetical protein
VIPTAPDVIAQKRYLEEVRLNSQSQSFFHFFLKFIHTFSLQSQMRSQQSDQI